MRNPNQTSQTTFTRQLDESWSYRVIDESMGERDAVPAAWRCLLHAKIYAIWWMTSKTDYNKKIMRKSANPMQYLNMATDSLL